MITFTLFAFSGAVLVTLTLAKRIEEKRKKSFFILRAISRGDERMRELHHQSVRFYSLGKEKTAFFVKKQLPMRSRNSLNKSLTTLREQAERFENLIRDSKLLRKSDGISEFFKNMSTVEKGNGEINDVYEDREVKPEPTETMESLAKISTFQPKPAVKRKRKSPVKKAVRLVVKEEVEY